MKNYCSIVFACMCIVLLQPVKIYAREHHLSTIILRGVDFFRFLRHKFDDFGSGENPSVNRHTQRVGDLQRVLPNDKSADFGLKTKKINAPKYNVTRLGYGFKSFYKIYLLKNHHASPLNVQLRVGQHPSPHKCYFRLREGAFAGTLSYTLGKKERRVGFFKMKGKLEVTKGLRASSIWYPALTQILAKIPKFDLHGAHKGKVKLAFQQAHTHPAFRIVPSKESGLYVQYGLAPKKRRSLDASPMILTISVKPEISTKDNKHVLIATAILKPRKSRKMYSEQPFVKFAVTKKEISEIERQRMETHHQLWYPIIKKMISTNVKNYFKFKHLHHSLGKTYSKKK